MGNAAIYYYPEADSALKVIDLGEPLSDLLIEPVRIVDTSTSRDWDVSTVDLGGTHRARMVLANFTGDELVAELRTFENHALRGLPFGIVSDTDYAFAAFLTNETISRGKTNIYCLGNVFFGWSNVIGLSAGDLIVIHGSNPEYKHEQHPITSFSTSTGAIGLGSYPTIYDYTVGPMVVRHRDFLPFCYLDPSKHESFITHNHRITYTLDLPVLYSPGGMKSLYSENGGQGTLHGVIEGGGGGSLQEAAPTNTAPSLGSYGITGWTP